MNSILPAFRKSLLVFALITGSIQAAAGTSVVLTKTEVIEIPNPANAFKCHLGDGGYIFTTVSISAGLLPDEFGHNFRHISGAISAYFSNQTEGAFPCDEAMKTIVEEIKKQGGQLKVKASRSLSRFAYPDNGCKLFLMENVQVSVGKLRLSGITSSLIKELPVSSVFECRDLIPDAI